MTDPGLSAGDLYAALDSALSHGVDILTRQIYLDGEITTERAAVIKRGLHVLGGLEPEKPITFYIDSPGGDLDASFAIRDAIQTIPCPIATVAIGVVESAAPLLLISGDQGERWITPQCGVMLHDVAVSWSDESPTHKVDAYVRGARAKMDEYARVLGRRTKRKAVFWRSLFKSGEDRYFTAHEAVELGLADAVWKERA